MRQDQRHGAAAVELAVLLPFLMFLAIIATDWARIFYYTITLDHCARSGALYAFDDEARARSPYASVSEAALAEAPQLSGTVSVSQSTVTDGGDGSAAVIVTVSMSFKTLMNFQYPSWFGVPQDNTITRSVQMRVMPAAPK